MPAKGAYPYDYKKGNHKCAFVYGLIDPRTDLFFYVGASVDPKKRTCRAGNYTCNSKVMEVFKELDSIGLKPTLKVLEDVSLDAKFERERHWIAKCYEEGHPLKNIDGFDTYTGELLFTMKIRPNKNARHIITATVTEETKNFIDKMATESVANKSDVLRHLIELGIKHFND